MAWCLAEVPEALANSVEIAKRCNLELDLGKVHLPGFDMQSGGTAHAYLRERAEAGLRARLEHNRIEAGAERAYSERLPRQPLGNGRGGVWGGFFLFSPLHPLAAR